MLLLLLYSLSLYTDANKRAAKSDNLCIFQYIACKKIEPKNISKKKKKSEKFLFFSFNSISSWAQYSFFCVEKGRVCVDTFLSFSGFLYTFFISCTLRYFGWVSHICSCAYNTLFIYFLRKRLILWLFFTLFSWKLLGESQWLITCLSYFFFFLFS